MNLACPCCGARASAQVWENDAAARDFVNLVANLPRPVANRILRYCGLFREPSAARAMSWAKALRLGQEIAELVAKGWVQVQGKPARPCTSEQWGEGMEKMQDMAEAGKLTLPLKNHNYMLQIVWQEADKSDAQAEQRYHASAAAGNARVAASAAPSSAPPAPVSASVPAIPKSWQENDGLSQFDRKYIATHGREAFDRLNPTVSLSELTRKLRSVKDVEPDEC